MLNGTCIVLLNTVVLVDWFWHFKVLPGSEATACEGLKLTVVMVQLCGWPPITWSLSLQRQIGY